MNAKLLCEKLSPFDAFIFLESAYQELLNGIKSNRDTLSKNNVFLVLSSRESLLYFFVAQKQIFNVL